MIYHITNFSAVAWLDFLKIFLFTVPKSIITKSVGSDEVGRYYLMIHVLRVIM